MKYYRLWLSCTLRPSGPTERLVNRLPFNVSDQLAQLVLVRTVDKHVRFNVINRGYDFFRRQQRQTHQTLNDVLDVLITSVRLFQADFVGALDNFACACIVEPAPGYASCCTFWITFAWDPLCSSCQVS